MYIKLLISLLFITLIGCGGGGSSNDELSANNVNESNEQTDSQSVDPNKEELDRIAKEEEERKAKQDAELERQRQEAELERQRQEAQKKADAEKAAELERQRLDAQNKADALKKQQELQRQEAENKKKIEDEKQEKKRFIASETIKQTKKLHQEINLKKKQFFLDSDDKLIYADVELPKILIEIRSQCKKNLFKDCKIEEVVAQDEYNPIAFMDKKLLTNDKIESFQIKNVNLWEATTKSSIKGQKNLVTSNFAQFSCKDKEADNFISCKLFTPMLDFNEVAGFTEVDTSILEDFEDKSTLNDKYLGQLSLKYELSYKGKDIDFKKGKFSFYGESDKTRRLSIYQKIFVKKPYLNTPDKLFFLSEYNMYEILFK